MPGIAKINKRIKHLDNALPARLWKRLYLAVFSYHAGLFFKTAYSVQRIADRKLNAKRSTLNAILKGDSVPANFCGSFMAGILPILTLIVNKNNFRHGFTQIYTDYLRESLCSLW